MYITYYTRYNMGEIYIFNILYWMKRFNRISKLLKNKYESKFPVYMPTNLI